MTTTILGFILASGWVLAGILITLYIKDIARTVVKETLADYLKSEFAQFEKKLFDSLDGKYKRNTESKLEMDNIYDRLDVVTARLTVHDENFKDITNYMRKHWKIEKED